jgi:hypothetical protein
MNTDIAAPAVTSRKKACQKSTGGRSGRHRAGTREVGVGALADARVEPANQRDRAVILRGRPGLRSQRRPNATTASRSHSFPVRSS